MSSAMNPSRRAYSPTAMMPYVAARETTARNNAVKPGRGSDTN